MLRGKKDRDFGCVSQHDKERMLSERKNLHEYLEKEAERALQDECTAQRGVSEAEADMDMRNWEERNSDVALYETNLNHNGLSCVGQINRLVKLKKQNNILFSEN